MARAGAWSGHNRILAAAEVPYVHTKTLHFTLPVGPFLHVAIVENQASGGGSLALIHGTAQFLISIVAILLSGIVFSLDVWRPPRVSDFHSILHPRARKGSIYLA